MRINNIEYDIDSLFEHSNINNSIEAARKLREATGITLKEAFDILEKYQIGIIDNNSDIKTSSPKFSLIPSSITSKILLAFLIPACVILILVFCVLLIPKDTNTSSTIEITQQSRTEPLTQQQKTTSASTAAIAQKTTTPRTTVQKSTTIQETTSIGKYENLKGRGHSDAGRQEPNYKNVIGYVVIGSKEEYSLQHTDSFPETPWVVPIYDKVEDDFTEIGFIEHKTKIIVKSQQLKHEGYGAYSGFLLVENIDTSEQFYINVRNFITNPYWTFSDLKEAVSIGDYIAEYNQVSDYPPVDSRNKKVDLDNGIKILVVGKTGLSGIGPNIHKNPIEAIVFKEWEYGYEAAYIYFNPNDLSILY